MRIYAASPIPLTAGSLHRHSYLVAKAMRAAGHESKVVRLPSRFEDPKGLLIQASLKEFCSASFWRRLELDAVYLLAWGDPRYTAVVKALKEAGIWVIEGLDTDGFISPASGWLGYMNRAYHVFRSRGQPKLLALSASLAKSCLHSRGIGFQSKLIEHLEYVDIICAESPPAVVGVQKAMLRRGRQDLAGRVTLLEHPVENYFHVDTNKENLVACTGRWDAYQKAPEFTAASLMSFLTIRKDYRAVVAGPLGREFLREIQTAPATVQERIDLPGNIENESLPGILKRAKIFYLPSRWEGCPLAAQEALCSGASVVGVYDVPAMRYLTENRSGSLIPLRTIIAATQTLEREATAWDNGARDSISIGRYASERFSCRHFVERLLAMLDL